MGKGRERKNIHEEDDARFVAVVPGLVLRKYGRTYRLFPSSNGARYRAGDLLLGTNFLSVGFKLRLAILSRAIPPASYSFPPFRAREQRERQPR